MRRRRGHVIIGTSVNKIRPRVSSVSTSPLGMSQSPRSSASPPPRRIVDFELDDGDKEWEDDDEQLQGLGTTTHRSRNRGQDVIPVRKRKKHTGGPNARASAQKRRESKSTKMSDFADDVRAWEDEREARVEQLVEKYGMKKTEVRRRLLSAGGFKNERKPSLYNAKIAAIMARLNEGAVGHKYNILRTKEKVREDPSLLDQFTEEEEGEMMEDILSKRELRRRGARANNLAADADARKTMDRLMEEITALAERSGMIGFAMFSRGHIHDTSIPVTIQSWGALEFFREVLKKDPVNVAALFELWAVQREKRKNGGDTLLDMQRECTEMISTGLRTVTAETKIAMNEKLYQRNHFKRMSKQSAIGSLRKLRDALRCGTCHWKVLKGGEKARLVAQFEDMVANGEATEKVRKSRKRKTQEEGSDEDGGDHEPQAKRKSRRDTEKNKRKPRRAAADDDNVRDKHKKSRRAAEDDESEEEEREAAHLRRLSSPARAQRAKLLALANGRKQAGTASGGKKRKRLEAEEEDDGRSKRPRNTEEEKRGKKRKGGDEGGTVKQPRLAAAKNTSRDAPSIDVVKARPRPIPAYKGASGSKAPVATPPSGMATASNVSTTVDTAVGPSDETEGVPPDQVDPRPENPTASMTVDTPGIPSAGTTGAPTDQVPPRPENPTASMSNASTTVDMEAIPRAGSNQVPPRPDSPAVSAPDASTRVETAPAPSGGTTSADTVATPSAGTTGGPPDQQPPRPDTPARSNSAPRANVIKGRRGGPPGRRVDCV
ncbi:hypothetical protein B0H15DRAFT_958482 [Mycena belliarum]|uniref:Uncharacterized protein n=1 Tax=Mycena belliarum TaxID=1033014 RepID=A0AAD6TME3_9AGAR|nr:hypothetical protein B0H15DRAFT_958482 [Mycena belliae]